MKTNLTTNPLYFEQFQKLKIIINNSPTPEDLDFVYDAAKRLINENGVGITFVEKLYILGYIDGIRSERKRRRTVYDRHPTCRRE